MTKQLLLSSFLLVCMLTSMLAQSPVEYMNQLGADYEAITKDAWGYIRVASRSRSARRINNRREDLLRTIREAKQRVRVMPGYEGDVTYRNAVVEYLDIYFKVLNQDYAEIMDLEEIAEQSYDAMEAYILAQEVAEETLHNAFEALDAEQEAFAAANNITMVEAEGRLSAKIRKASEANDYYNDVFLLFFKAYKQEFYMMEALNAGDVNALEQSKSALVSIAEEGLGILENMPRFNNDLSLKIAATEALRFYKMEGGASTDDLVNFFLAKSEFEEIKETLDTTPKRQRTQEMVDSYNESVNEYNRASTQFNQVLERLNRQRAEVIEKWEKTGESFMKEHVPR